MDNSRNVTNNISVDATTRQQEGQAIGRDIDIQLAASNAGVGH
ncbi:hypothetical protein [Mycolicibacterium mengxianglii]|nr:hypothetical protein [Mycolicibacterium mengxianglii]